MKKIILLLAAAFVSCMVMMSCNDKPDDKHLEYPPLPPIDNSLAGSVSHFGTITKAEGSYDGVIFEGWDYKQSGICTDKVSDTEVSLNVRSKWGDIIVSLLIPVIPLSGVPYNVTFDHWCNDVTVEYQGVKYSDVETSVKGWIKERSRVNMSVFTRDIPIPPDYVSEIDIECIVNGKILILTLYD